MSEAKSSAPEALKLDYTAINIANAEKSEGKSFFEAFAELSGTPSVSSIVFLMRAGGAADDQINESFNKGIDNCFTDIMAGLNDSGFLGEIDLDVEKMAKEMQKVKDELKNTNSSETTGEASNQKPTQ